MPKLFVAKILFFPYKSHDKSNEPTVKYCHLSHKMNCISSLRTSIYILLKWNKSHFFHPTLFAFKNYYALISSCHM